MPNRSRRSGDGSDLKGKNVENTNSAPAEVYDPVAAIADIIKSEDSTEEAPQENVASEVETEPTVADAAQEGEAEDDGYEDVEYEGTAYKLPRELKEALMRNADYTRKTQEVAESRRTLEAQHEAVKAQQQVLQEEAAFQQVAQQDMAEIAGLQSALKQYDGLDWTALSQSDPVQAQTLWFQYQQARDKVSQLQGGLRDKYQQFQQKKQEAMAQAFQKGLEVLKRDIPNWSPELAKEIREAGIQHYGYQAGELENVYDPRFVKLLADAAAYRKLQAQKPDLTRRVAGIPKTVKPGAQQTNQARKAEAAKESFARLSKTGKLDDAAKAIAHLI